MKCPICNQAEINEDSTSCPDCHSDLEGLSHIKKIGDILSKQKKYLTGISIVALAAIIFLSFTLASKKETVTPPISTEELNKLKADNTSLSGKVDELNTGITNLKNELEELKKKEQEESNNEIEQITTASETENQQKSVAEDTEHTVTGGETLFLIAKKYLGAGHKYEQLAQDNNISDPNLIVIGQTIKIKSN